MLPQIIEPAFELNFQLVVHEDLYLDNVFNILRFEAIRNQLKLRQPVNKEKWALTPALTINHEF